MGAEIKVGDWVWLQPEKDAVIAKKTGAPTNRLERLACQIVSMDGNVVKFQSAFSESDQYVRDSSKIDQNAISVIHESTLSGISDMSMLADMHVEAILFNIYLRFKEKAIYTYVGSILVSVNPYERFQHVYANENLARYRDARIFEESPHVYAIANEAFLSMQIKNKNQCVLISGESGAGKTEATKLILTFLSFVSEDKTLQVEKQIQSSSPILEALGNAKTVYNNNSSRFGKYIDIQYDLNGKSIVGARMEDYLLEKSRVTKQSEQERNFHIFYMLLTGHAESELKAKYNLTNNPKDYYYTSQSGCYSAEGIDDVHDYSEMITAMPLLGFLEEDKHFIFKIIAAILHIGNLRITNSSGAVIGNKDSLDIICGLLRVNRANLERALIKTVRYLRGEEIISNLTVPQAEDTRDSLAGALYAKMFKWVIEKINEMTLYPNHSGNTIGVLDIFGFENFADNSLEQLCINYANEKLAQYFNVHIFSLEQAEYAKEGVNWQSISFKNNEECLHLIERTGISVISVLDEQSKIANATSVSFVDSLHGHFDKKSTYYIKPRFAKESFGIIHYAGEVTYNTSQFLVKNKDTFKEDLLEVLATSEDPLISRLFTVNSKEKPKTISTQFKTSLVALMVVLNSTNPWFVRCIKPNMMKKSELFVPETVLNQLLYSGMLETVRIRRAGYPIRHLFMDFILRFQILHPGLVTMEESGQLNRDDYKRKTELIVKHVSDLLTKTPLLGGSNNSGGQNPIGEIGGNWQIGKSKVFLKESVDLVLENLRGVEMKKALSVIKTLVSAYIIQRRFKLIMQKTIYIQCHIRRFLAERLLVRMKKQRALEIRSATKIQGCFRIYVAKKILYVLKAEKAEKVRLEKERIRREEEEKRRILLEQAKQDQEKLKLLEQMEFEAKANYIKEQALLEERAKKASENDREKMEALIAQNKSKEDMRLTIQLQNETEQARKTELDAIKRAEQEMGKNVEILELQIGLKSKSTKSAGQTSSESGTDGSGEQNKGDDDEDEDEEDNVSGTSTKRDAILKRKEKDLYAIDKLFVEGFLLLETKPNKFEQKWFRLKDGKLMNYGMRLKVEYFKTGFLGYKPAAKGSNIFTSVTDKRYKPKWFVVKGLDLFLFDNDTDPLPKLMFPITNGKFEPFSDKKNPFCIEFTSFPTPASTTRSIGGGQSSSNLMSNPAEDDSNKASNKQLSFKFHLSCSDAESRKSWIDVFMHVCDLATAAAKNSYRASHRSSHHRSISGTNKPVPTAMSAAPVGVSDSTASEKNTIDLLSILKCAPLDRDDKLRLAHAVTKSLKEGKELENTIPDYMFTVETRDKTWVCSAGGDAERKQWIEFLQPKRKPDDELMEGQCDLHYTKNSVFLTKCWIILLGSTLNIYKSHSAKSPLYSIPFDHKTVVSQVHVNQVQQHLLGNPATTPSGQDTMNAMGTKYNSIFLGTIRGPITILLNNPENTEKWLNWIQKEGIENSPIKLTETELFYINFSKTIARVSTKLRHSFKSMTDKESKRVFLKQVYSRSGFRYLIFEASLISPLTSIPYFDEFDQSDLSKLALMMFKLNTTIYKNNIETNILNLQAGLEIALKYPDLQDEAYLQIIKQLIGRPHYADKLKRTSSRQNDVYTSNSALNDEDATEEIDGEDTSKLEKRESEEEDIVILMAKNLTIMVQSFMPSKGLVPYILASVDYCIHIEYKLMPMIQEPLQSAYDLLASNFGLTTSVTGLNALAATKSVLHPPSHMEIMSIYANTPMVVTIYTLDNVAFHVPIKSDTTASQVLCQVLTQLKLTHSRHSFALYEDLKQYRCRLIDHPIRLKQVLARWEHLKKKNYDISRWKLVVRMQCYNKPSDSANGSSPSSTKIDPEEDRLLVYQAHDSLLRGWIDMKQQGIFKLAAFRLQLEFGDYTPEFDFNILPHGVASYVPYPLIEQIIGTSSAKELVSKGAVQQTSTKGKIDIQAKSSNSSILNTGSSLISSSISLLRGSRGNKSTTSTSAVLADSPPSSTHGLNEGLSGSSPPTSKDTTAPMKLSDLRKARSTSSNQLPPSISVTSLIMPPAANPDSPASPSPSGAGSKLVGTLKRRTLGRFKTLSSRSDKNSINKDIGGMIILQWEEMKGYASNEVMEDYLSIVQRYDTFGHYVYPVENDEDNTKLNLMVTKDGVVLMSSDPEDDTITPIKTTTYKFSEIYGTEIPERNKFQLYTSANDKITFTTSDDEHIEISKILQAFLDPSTHQITSFQ